MFQGTTPPDAVKIVQETVKFWGIKRLYNLCCGNFTIERAMFNAGLTDLVSNDVSVYSTALGFYFSGKGLAEFKPRKGIPERCAFALSRFSTDEEKLSTILLVSNYGGCMFRQGDYYNEQLEEVKAQWDSMIDKQVDKLGKMTFRLSGFECMDCFSFLEQIPDTDDVGIYTFPPFKKGGYERMFDFINRLVEWPTPEYRVFGDEQVLELLEKLSRRKHWIFGTHYYREDLKNHLVGTFKTTNRGLQCYLYASDFDKARIVVPNQNIRRLDIIRLRRGEKIGDKMEIHPIDGASFNCLRAQYLNKNISPASPEACFAVTVDGKLIGAFAHSRGEYTIAGIEPPYLYGMSDFPVSGTDYKRLSKLIVMASISKEAQEFYEMKYGTRIVSSVTTAFSRRPASMKYRGILKLCTSQKGKDGEYILNYGGRFGEWTLDQALKEWKKNNKESKEDENKI